MQRQTDPEFFYHVSLARIIEVDLNGAGPEHHVEAERADARHVPQHDVIAALRHDWQLVAALVGPEAEAEKAKAQFVTGLLTLLQVAAGFGASFVKRSQRCPRQLKLACRLQTDPAIAASHGNDGATLQHRFPAELGHFAEQVADAAFLRIGRSPVVSFAIDEFLMLGADPPVCGGLAALFKNRDQIVAGFDGIGIPDSCGARAHSRRNSPRRGRMPAPK